LQKNAAVEKAVAGRYFRIFHRSPPTKRGDPQASPLGYTATRQSPPWIRRGGCATIQMSRSLISRRRRGGWFKAPIMR
jgi:hypothetical protein